MYRRCLVAFLLSALFASIFVPLLFGGGTVDANTFACKVVSNYMWGKGVTELLENEFADGDEDETPVSPGPSPQEFEPNRGQTDRAYDWISRGRGYFVFLNASGAVIDMRDRQGRGNGIVRAEFRGANPTAAAIPSGYRSLVHYILGADSSRWITNIPRFSEISYSNVYDGIDLRHYRNDGLLEHDWIVRPGADASRIRLAFPGADSIRIDSTGNLLIRSGQAELKWHAPKSLERRSGRAVESAWELGADHTVGFRLGKHNRNETLVIDPAIEYLTYLGRGGYDVAARSTVDAQGNLYLTGATSEGTWPTTPGAVLVDVNGVTPTNTIITKLSANGNDLIYSTILGGEGFEGGSDITLDAQGNIIITGITGSNSFPTTEGVIQRTPPPLPPSSPDVTNCYVTKLNPAGNAVLFSTLLGGSGLDVCMAVKTDREGNIYLAGSTGSNDFPTTPDVFQSRLRLGTGVVAHDIFVVKLNPTGTQRIFSTLIGGGGHDWPLAMALDATGAVYLTGATSSANFPVTPGAYQSTYSGGGGNDDIVNQGDAFVVKLAPGGGSLAYATYVGGRRDDMGLGIAVDAQGNAIIAGNTLSTNFPVTSGALQTQFRGVGGEPAVPAGDAFVLKLNATGTQAVFSTLLGGTLDDRATTVSLDPAGSIWVAGHTHSRDFPVTPDAPQSQNRTSTSVSNKLKLGDGFVASLTPDGSRLQFATYLGGSVSDFISGMAIGADGSVYVSGFTNSGDLQTTAASYQPRFFGGIARQAPFDDLFVARFGASSGVSIAAVANAASYAQNTVSPGMIATLAGNGIGPAQLAVGGAVSGRLPTSLGGTRVLFDDTPAPVIYVSSGQTSVVVPYNVNGKRTVQVVVERDGQRSAPLTVTVAAAVPALFSANASGQGPGAFLNQDGRINTPQNPADQQSIVILYGTGEGAVSNTPADGALVDTPLPIVQQPVRVTVAGREAEVLYAGGAPGLIAGLLQVNIKLPPNVPAGNQPVVLTVGTANSPAGVTLAVR